MAFTLRLLQQRLNPFEIRAGQKQLTGLSVSIPNVLIPLKSGQARNEVEAIESIALACLNPFEIRAGQKLWGAVQLRRERGLNPFEIRAGQKPSAPEWVRFAQS